MGKKDEKVLRKERKKERRAKMRDVKLVRGKWLSNATEDDVVKIKRAFPKVLVGIPRSSGQLSVEYLSSIGLVGLYLGEKE